VTRFAGREHLVEAAVGFLVVLIAVWFVLFSWNRTGGGARAGAMQVNALFPNAAGVNVGTDVRVAGLKVGTVSAQRLDPQTFQVAVTMAIDPDVKIPADSSAAITSEGLLGGTYVALLPGGDPNPLKNGDTIVDTQGSMDLMGLIGGFINKPASGSGGSGDASSSAESGSTAP
jgi:phospholipid/cholesterol/gamma-HCH transport system substrate-binding protein